MPAEDQEIALPWASVMVTMVLLKLAFTCAMPLVMFLRSRRLMRWGSRAISVYPVAYVAAETENRSGSLLLLAGDRLGLALAGARIGVRALATDGEPLAVTQATVAGEKIGRAHVCTPVTNAHLVCRHLLEK